MAKIQVSVESMDNLFTSSEGLLADVSNSLNEFSDMLGHDNERERHTRYTILLNINALQGKLSTLAKIIKAI